MITAFPAPEFVHFTNLKNFALSPAHYIASLANEEKKARPLTLGALSHTLILGGQSVAIWKGTRRQKGYEAFAEEHEEAGELVVTESEHIRATRIVTAVRMNRDAMKALEGDHEIELEWTTDTGRKAAGRIDVLGARHVTELKTTRFAKPEWFTGEALRRAYHAQLAWYLDGITARTGKPMNGGAKIVAVESSPPFAVTVFEVTPRALDEGRKQIRLWLERLAACEAVNEWPAYVQAPVELDAPEAFELEGLDDEDNEDSESNETERAA